MLTCEVIDAALEMGLPATLAKLYHGLRTGKIPEPERDHLGNRTFQRQHVEAFVQYLEHPPRPGRRRRERAGVR